MAVDLESLPELKKVATPLRHQYRVSHGTSSRIVLYPGFRLSGSGGL